MKKTFCPMAFDHEPGETCPQCNEAVDSYGNTESDFQNCCFPDCGCDGARLCMAGEANENARGCNVEGMWLLKGSDQGGKIGEARMRLLKLVHDKEPPTHQRAGDLR